MREPKNAGDDNDNTAIIDRHTRGRDVTIDGSTRRSDGARIRRCAPCGAGEVTDVDRNSGKVNIRASDGSKIQVILPPLAVATANKGDRAPIDITIGPMR